MKSHIAFTLGLVLVGAGGCDALVGGRCADGYRENAGLCEPLLVAEQGDGGDGGSAGEDGHFGASGGGQPAGGNTTLPSCEEPSTYCPASGCVSLESDISNCGACGVHCPTELCVDGACVGEPVGHTVAIGASYQQSTPSARRILGNAVFRTLHRPLRIAELRGLAPAWSSSEADEAIASEAALRGRSYSLTPLGAGQLAAQLEAGIYDVLVIHDQAGSDDSELAELGQQIAGSLESYRAGGGTVVSLATHRGKANSCNFLATAGVLDCVSIAPTNQLVDNVLPTDTIGNGVIGPFVPKPATSVFELGDALGFVTVFSSEGAPVVLHQAWSP